MKCVQCNGDEYIYVSDVPGNKPIDEQIANRYILCKECYDKKYQIKCSFLEFIESLYEQLEPFNVTSVACELVMDKIEWDILEAEQKYSKKMYTNYPTVRMGAGSALSFTLDLSYIRGFKDADRD